MFVAAPAFQLDGIFIGLTRGAEMRNSSVLSTLIFFAASLLLTEPLGNLGLWWAFILYAAARGATLWLRLYHRYAANKKGRSCVDPDLRCFSKIFF